jgi:hypothetical protein
MQNEASMPSLVLTQGYLIRTLANHICSMPHTPSQRPLLTEICLTQAAPSGPLARFRFPHSDAPNVEMGDLGQYGVSLLAA